MKKTRGATKRFLWITDPWNTLDHSKDTTLRLIEESLENGIENYWSDYQTIRLLGQDVLLDACRVTDVASSRGPRDFQMLPAKLMPVSAFQSVHYRPDPPVDLGYTHPLQLLALAAKKHSGIEIVNPAETLLCANEKIEGALLGELMPRSLVSSNWEVLFSFGQSEGRTVLKPLHQAQSKGVELLDWSPRGNLARNKNILSELTGNFTRPVIMQRYLEGIREGEQRLWFLDGKLLAVARKRPKSGEFKVDMDQGGSLEPTRLSVRDKKTIPAISKRLNARGIRLAAIDLIESQVTDFNFTSPGLLVQIENLLKVNLARPVIRALLKSR